jgi:hypothetical protein
MMDTLVDCVDRWGRRIVLTEARWRLHIVPGHDPLLGNERAVLLALTDPDLAMHDADHADRESFSRRGALPPPLDHLYLKVAVGFSSSLIDGADRGFVITAFPIPVVKRRERPKWRR